MKKSVLLFVIASLLVFPMVSAKVFCSLDISLINQDPYPAIPGDYVDVVFQIDGVGNPDCGLVTFEVKEEFPFSLDPGETNPITIRSGTYDRKYASFYIAPYSLRVDDDALDGDNPLEVVVSTTQLTVTKEFNINIDDVRVDFEIFVKDYDPNTNMMTFEILNIGENDVEALTIEIPEQETITVKGANKNVVGDLDSNEYTTADFEATSEGGEIELEIKYTDAINVRRTLTETISFDPNYFTGRKEAEKGIGVGVYLVILVVIILVIWFWRKKKRQKRMARR